MPRENPEDDPIRVSNGEAIVLLNRAGLTLDQANRERSPFEVEVLLMDQMMQWEAMRKKTRSEEIPIHENRPGEAAPGWVNQLPEEEG